jgi:hypothetical protein
MISQVHREFRTDRPVILLKLFGEKHQNLVVPNITAKELIDFTQFATIIRREMI